MMRFNNLPWYQVEDWGQTAYYTPALAGSQTLLMAILKHFEIADPGFGKRRALVHELKGVKRYQYPPLGLERIGFIRHPLDRFISLLKNLKTGQPIKVPHQLRDYTDLQVLKHVMLRLEENMHWIPQAHGLQGANWILPIYDMEEELPIKVAAAHETVYPLDLSQDLRLAVCNLYSLDCKLYDQVM